MKRYFVLLSILFLWVNCKNNEEKQKDSSVITSSEKSKIKRYEVKSGKVFYKTTTDGKVMGFNTQGEGIIKLVFDDFGNLEIKDQQASVRTYGSIMGQKTDEIKKTHELVKYDNGVVYSVDFNEKIIYKNTKLSDQIQKFLGSDFNKTAKEYAESLGGKQIGEELFQGYTCEIWEIMGTKTWLYKGVPLKLEGDLMGVKVTQVATSINFGSVSLKEFELPNFTIKEMELGTDSSENIENAGEFIKNMNDIKKLTFEEWKKNMQMADKSFREMNDSELRQLYEEMQKMSELTN